MNKSEAIDIMRNLQSMIVSPHKQDKETVFAIQMGIDALKARDVPDTNAEKWISVKEGMPPEKETIFAKFKGTDQWSPAMFATSSEDVRVVVQFEDGTRKVWHDNTMDGKWKCERDNVYPKRTVIYWMPNPELPKEKT